MCDKKPALQVHQSSVTSYGGDNCEIRYSTHIESSNDVDVSSNTTQSARSGDVKVSYNTNGGNARSGDARNSANTEIEVVISNR